MYEVISRNRVHEPQRGQNYSDFYYTTYIVVEFDNINEQQTFKFYEETEDEINIKIEEWQLIYLQEQQIITGEQPQTGL